ncbi:MAG: DUF4381 domain-containing protein, partial [Gammaproteobacteria bacterium]|nr:DUF4381 domain-containing protein [Gammaproteobacteria bacterium]
RSTQTSATTYSEASYYKSVSGARSIRLDSRGNIYICKYELTAEGNAVAAANIALYGINTNDNLNAPNPMTEQFAATLTSGSALINYNNRKLLFGVGGAATSAEAGSLIKLQNDSYDAFMVTYNASPWNNKAGSAANPVAPTSLPQQKPKQKRAPLPTPAEPASGPSSSAWTPVWWIVLGFVLAILVFSVVLWMRQSSQGSARRKRLILKKIQQTCKNNDPAEAQSLLLRWANIQWPEQEVLSLQQLAKLLHDASFKKQLSVLSEILYSDKEHARRWQGVELWRSLADYLRIKPAKRKKFNKLPPINPIG